MADSEVSDLPDGSTVESTDELALNEAGTTKKCSMTQLATFVSPAASDTVPGVIEIATVAETETGSDTTRAVVVGRQHRHPSMAKAWVASTQSSTTIQESFGVTSVADTATGRLTVTVSTAFAAATYCVVVGAEHNSASATTQTYQIDNGSRTTTTYIVESWQTDLTEVLTDPSASWFSIAFGDQ